MMLHGGKDMRGGVFADINKGGLNIVSLAETGVVKKEELTWDEIVQRIKLNAKVNARVKLTLH